MGIERPDRTAGSRRRSNEDLRYMSQYVGGWSKVTGTPPQGVTPLCDDLAWYRLGPCPKAGCGWP